MASQLGQLSSVPNYTSVRRTRRPPTDRKERGEKGVKLSYYRMGLHVHHGNIDLDWNTLPPVAFVYDN